MRYTYMLLSRRDTIKLAGALPLVSRLLQELETIEETVDSRLARTYREATWEELVHFFDSVPRINPEWKRRRRDVHLYYTLKIYFKDGRLVADFLHGRYSDRGLLWCCRHLDEKIERCARRRARWLPWRPSLPVGGG